MQKDFDENKAQLRIAADCVVHLEGFLKEFGLERMVHTVTCDDQEKEYIIIDEIKKAIKLLYYGGLENEKNTDNI